MNSISFPKLGIDLNISPIAFHIGAKPIYWYALIILTGFGCGLLLASAHSGRRGISAERIWDIALYGLVSGIIGARIYYVLFSPDEFAGDPLGVFKIWEGGLAIYGGIIGALISTTVYCKICRVNLPNALDVCCPGLLLGQAIGRWGNFTNCEVFGRATDAVTGMSINGAAPVHPLFFYESVWSFLGVAVILLFRNKKTKNGQVFCTYLMWYGIGRLVLEGMRDTDYILYLIPNVLGVSQLVSLLVIIAAAVGFIVIHRSDLHVFAPLPPLS